MSPGSSSENSLNALSVARAVRSLPARLDDVAYSRRFLRWVPTHLLDESTGFRLDVATDTRHGTVRGMRAVPLLLELEDGYQPELPWSAITTLTRAQVAAAVSQPGTSETLPPELQQRVDALLTGGTTRSGNARRRRPNADSIHIAAWHEVILDITEHARDLDRAAAPLVAKAFGVSLSTADRWVKDAEGWSGS